MFTAVLNFITTAFAMIIAVFILRQSNPVTAAFALIVLAAVTAIRWALLGASFFSLILMLIYLGAVLILFLFVVMTLSQKNKLENEIQKYSWQSVLGSAIGIIVLIGSASYYPIFSQKNDLSHVTLDINFVLNALSINAEVLMQMVGLFLLLALVVSVLLVKKNNERSSL